jgi:biopolymer transport protein TolR
MQIRYSEDTPFLSEINMIPFIDVALVLLIIFMIITPVMMLNSVQVQLPQSSSEKQAPTKNLVVAVKPDGSVYLNNEPVTPGLLTDKVKMLMKQMPESALIYADKKVDVATVVSVIDQIEAGGLHTISLTTERKTAAPDTAQPN